MRKMKKYSALCRAAVFLLTASLACPCVSAMADVRDEAIYTPEGYEDYAAETAAQMQQPIATNEVPGWPQGPAVGAGAAIVMDADSGVILYGKNVNKHLYPASITKLMTGLLAYENLSPSDTVTFSENAVFGIERGSSNIGMDVNESITVDEALYGLMVASANEVAIALGERVSGTESDFVSLMNQRAEELGCKNTHFVTTNGLHDKKHYSCVYDMALIAREMYKYPKLINYMGQNNYEFKASENQPDSFWLGNTNDFLNGLIDYEPVVAGKTGYTDEARETLVTFAEKDGMRLICVIMKEEPPKQYYDTKDLLEYAFDNFKKINITEEENRFTLQSEKFLLTDTEIFGNSRSLCSIPENTMLMIPKDASFADLTAEILPFSYAPAEDTPSNNPSSDTPKEPSESAEDTDNKENKENKEENSSETPAPDSEVMLVDALNTDPAAGTDTDPAAKAAAGTDAGPTAKAAEGTDADPAAKTAADTGTDTASKAAAGTEEDTEAKPAPAASDPDQALPEFDADRLSRINPVQEDGTRILGVVRYKYNDFFLGTANVLFKPAEKAGAQNSTASAADHSGTASTTAASDVELPKGSERAARGTAVPEEVHGMRAVFFNLAHLGAHGSIYLNILFVLPILLGISFLLCVIFFIHGYFTELERRRRRRKRRAGRAQAEDYRQYGDEYDSGDVPQMSGGRSSVNNRGSRTVNRSGNRSGRGKRS